MIYAVRVLEFSSCPVVLGVILQCGHLEFWYERLDVLDDLEDFSTKGRIE